MKNEKQRHAHMDTSCISEGIGSEQCQGYWASAWNEEREEKK